MSEQSRPAKAGKYLTFALADGEYGVEILKVHEIIGMMNVTAVRRMPGYIRGVINLRGRVVPVVDLRVKLGLERLQTTEQTAIVVVEVNRKEVGVVVDCVSEVCDIVEEAIDDASSFDGRIRADYVGGLGWRGDRLTVLLDMDRVLASDELAALSDARSEEDLYDANEA